MISIYFLLTSISSQPTVLLIFYHFNFQIKQLSAEINTLIEKRMVRNDPIDDKLSLFRQQVSSLLFFGLIPVACIAWKGRPSQSGVLDPIIFPSTSLGIWQSDTASAYLKGLCFVRWWVLVRIDPCLWPQCVGVIFQHWCRNIHPHIEDVLVLVGNSSLASYFPLKNFGLWDPLGMSRAVPWKGVCIFWTHTLVFNKLL